MSRIRAVVLDFDGVLVESNAVKDRAFEVFFSRYPECEEALLAYHRTHHARPRREKFEYAAGLLGRAGDGALVQEMSDSFSALVREQVMACAAVPGAVEFLREFSPLLPLYISSVTPQEELQAIVRARGWDRFVAHIFGHPPVPKEEAIACVLQREGLRPEQVLFVGDSPSDYEVARRCELLFWGRDSGRPLGDGVEVFADMAAIAGALRARL